ncbi:MAG: hypothetical protein ABI612_19605 [Betaproteobacteria bacterium]
MPDLSGLFRKTMLTFLLSQVFQSAGAQGYLPRAFQTNLVRLTDKALEDYELARSAFQEYVTRSSNNMRSPLFRATGHMENCFGSLERARRYARRLLEDTETTELVTGFSVLAPDVKRRIGTIRNAIEHTDDRLISEQIKDGDLVMLLMGEDAVELQQESILYTELATWLTELHALADKAARFGAKYWAAEQHHAGDVLRRMHLIVGVGHLV